MKKEIKVCIEEYINSFYGKRKPNKEAFRRKCKQGKIPNAIQEGSNWYLIVEEETLKQSEKKS